MVSEEVFKMILQKKFKFSSDLELVCVNKEDVYNYICIKVNEFKIHSNCISKQKKIELLEEILKMYDEDIEIDMFGVSEIIYSDKVNLCSMIVHFLRTCAYIYDCLILNYSVVIFIIVILERVLKFILLFYIISCVLVPYEIL